MCFMSFSRNTTSDIPTIAARLGHSCIPEVKRAWLDRARLAAGLAQPLLYLFVLARASAGARGWAAGAISGTSFRESSGCRSCSPRHSPPS